MSAMQVENLGSAKILEVIERAESGNDTAMPELREVLDLVPVDRPF